ncbi:MAG: endolytic transglycosylase MltG [Terrimonas sp.]|nr:endolytic transglycosylase MltG [Terrimonas sp.]
MKKILIVLFLIILVTGGYFAWKIFGPSVHQPKGKYFYIQTGEGYAQVRQALLDSQIIENKMVFEQIAKKLDYPQHVKPGRYFIPEGTSIIHLIRKLRSGDQAPVNLVISRKIRIKEDLAKITGNRFEFDAADMYHYLENNDSLRKFGLDSTSFVSAIFPDTYTFFWNSTPDKIMTKLFEASQKFWTEERKIKAAAIGLTPLQVYTLASIVEEESNYAPEKPEIASVYLNRIARGIPLQADPTIKFAMKDFSLRRILNSHLRTVSPYNTYLNKGLPPGPICTVQKQTIDAVLDAPKTDYIYFVAKSDFSGSHIFTSDYDDHLKYARLYQKAIDSLLKAKQKDKDAAAAEKVEK